MKPLRALVALLLVATLAVMVTRVFIPRISCNLAKGRINRSVRGFSRIGDDFRRTELARANLEECQRCLAYFPEDHQLYTLYGTNLRFLGRLDEALDAFKKALTLTERPEIYAQIGEIEIERGNIEAGRAAVTKAAMFHMLYIEVVAEPMRSEINAVVQARYTRLREKAEGKR